MGRITITTTDEEDALIREALTSLYSYDPDTAAKEYLVTSLKNVVGIYQQRKRVVAAAAQPPPVVDPKHTEPVKGKDFDLPPEVKEAVVEEIPTAKTFKQKVKGWFRK